MTAHRLCSQSIESMDSTDCFILDAGAKIYVYHGPNSSAFEKQKATSLGETMESERNGRAERVDREYTSCNDACPPAGASPLKDFLFSCDLVLPADAAFWRLLGGTEDQVTDKGESWRPPVFEPPKLYSMHDETHQ